MTSSPALLPNPQAGDAVDLPLTGTAPVVTNASDVTTGTQTGMSFNYIDGTKSPQSSVQTDSSGYAVGANAWSGTIQSQLYPSNLEADLSAASAATINQLRESFQLQAFLERSQMGGQRYKEIIYSMFGTLTADSRLDRPELLGTGRSRINVTPIPQTSSTDTTTPQANMSGYGTVAFSGHKFNKSFTEHGMVIGLMCVFADLNYQQGIEKTWSYRDRFDFYWPAFRSSRRNRNIE